MIKPLIPPNEKERIKSLRDYSVLDSIPENDYDDLTKIAALICETPIALISFVDSDRQFIKARYGLTVSETPRNDSFCAYAINSPSELFVVNDARKDKRFENNPFVSGYPHFVFYAGMPLVSDSGGALGTICVIDNQPRQLSEEQKQALKILAKQTVKLLQLRKKNREHKETQKKLEEYATEKESFAYTAAHELKEPVRVIKAFLKLLEAECGNLLNTNAQKYFKNAHDGAERMDVLINDLLEYSNALAEKKRQCKEIKISEVIEEIKTELKFLMEQKGVLIKIAPMPVVCTSPVAIKRIFLNLINNAIKYQLPETTPEISIEVTEDDSYWQFSVSDNGIGIPEELQNIIFDSFKRLHRKEEYPGNGLGLAICKRSVEELGGEIWVRSEEGKGSVFYFKILKTKKE